MHHLCPGCLDNKNLKSILQFYSDAKRLAECTTCKTRYRFADDPPLTRRRGGWIA